MELLPEEDLAKFMTGEYAMHYVPWLLNRIWNERYIGNTFMRYSKGPDGILEITLRPENLKTWALSLHARFRLEDDITNFAG